MWNMRRCVRHLMRNHKTRSLPLQGNGVSEKGIRRRFCLSAARSGKRRQSSSRYFLKTPGYFACHFLWDCRGSKPDLKIGDILCGDIVKEHPDKAEALTLEASGQREAYGLQDGLLSDTSQNGPASCCKGVIVSSDVMVGEPALRDELYRRYSGSCVEMESAGVLRACVESHCSFLAVKVISDYADNRSLLSILRSQRWIMENLAHRLRAAL